MTAAVEHPIYYFLIGLLEENKKKRLTTAKPVKLVLRSYFFVIRCCMVSRELRDFDYECRYRRTKDNLRVFLFVGLVCNRRALMKLNMSTYLNIDQGSLAYANRNTVSLLMFNF